MKIIIVDDNLDFANLLQAYVLRESDIEVVATAKDGIEGLEAITRYKPDVVILDLIMPQLDGLGVLEKIAGLSKEQRPGIIVLSAIGHEKQIKRAMQLGADYYILKPFDIDILLRRIRDTYESRKSHTGVIDYKKDNEKNKLDLLEKQVILLLHQLGIKANLSGYRFLKEAIKLSVIDENVFTSVTKILYPRTAENCKSSPQKVERAIRNAIECAWKEEYTSLKTDLFGNMVSKPSNSQFISTIAEKIKSGATA